MQINKEKASKKSKKGSFTVCGSPPENGQLDKAVIVPEKQNKIFPRLIEAISKLLKIIKMPRFDLTKGAFSAVALPSSHKASEDRAGSNTCHGAAGPNYPFQLFANGISAIF